MSVSCEKEMEKPKEQKMTIIYPNKFEISISFDFLNNMDDESFNILRECVDIEFLRRKLNDESS